MFRVDDLVEVVEEEVKPVRKLFVLSFIHFLITIFSISCVN